MAIVELEEHVPFCEGLLVAQPVAHFGEMRISMASPSGDYFATELLTDEWTKGGRPFSVHYYRRPLEGVLRPLVAGGFTLERVIEPWPLPECRELYPDDWTRLTTRPWFLFVSASQPG